MTVAKNDVKNNSQKYEYYIWYGVIAITVFIFILVIVNFVLTRTAPLVANDEYQGAERESAVEATSLYQALVSGTTASGDVAIEITPTEITKNELKMKISVNTHSVDLGQFDLSQNMVLRYQNTVALPLSAPQLQAHHTSGDALFPIEGRINEFTIIITGIPATQKRIFKWSQK